MTAKYGCLLGAACKASRAWLKAKIRGNVSQKLRQNFSAEQVNLTVQFSVCLRKEIKTCKSRKREHNVGGFSIEIIALTNFLNYKGV